MTLATSLTSTSNLLEILKRKLDKNKLPETRKRRTAKDSVSDSLKKTSLKKMQRWPLKSHRIRLSYNHQ